MPSDPHDKRDVFISYSRANTEFARDLYAKLESQGFTLWRDRSEMEVGEKWLRQIEEAIGSVDTMVLCLSPEAIASPNVSYEWRYARSVGTRVVPVVAATVDFNRVPKWMGKIDWADFRAADAFGGSNPEATTKWLKFLADLRAPYISKRVPFMVEDLPKDFVRREDEMQALKTALLRGEDRSNPVAITAALRGAGGYGKTTLAQAICHEDEVQLAFDDGVLWVTLGEKLTDSDLYSKVDGLYYALRGEKSNAPNLEVAADELRKLLADKDLLLVIDDVWNPDHLRPFLGGGKHCARLITTRNHETLPNDALTQPVDAMKQAEAIQLLRYGLPSGEDHALAELAKALGEWALLLKLANGVLRKQVELGRTLPHALAAVRDDYDKIGVTGFDSRSDTSRKSAVGKCLEVSLAQLSDEERARFAELAIFPEDTDVPLEAVAKLWSANTKRRHTERLCETLYNFSLLLALDLQGETLRLHDVIRKYLCGKLGKPTLESLHDKFLRAYGVTDWADLLPDEPYLWDYLAYHLIEAGKRDELRATLLDYRYLQAKLERKDLNSLLNDFSKIQKEPAEAGDPKIEAVRYVQYALWLSEEILEEDKAQLPLQLIARLYEYKEQAAIKKLTEDARQKLSIPRLDCLQPQSAFHQANAELVRRLKKHTSSVLALVQDPDQNQIKSCDESGITIQWNDEGKFLEYLHEFERVPEWIIQQEDGQILARIGDAIHPLNADFSPKPELDENFEDMQVLPDGRVVAWRSSGESNEEWVVGFVSRNVFEEKAKLRYKGKIATAFMTPEGETVIVVNPEEEQTLPEVQEGQTLMKGDKKIWTTRPHLEIGNPCALSNNRVLFSSGAQIFTLELESGTEPNPLHFPPEGENPGDEAQGGTIRTIKVLSRSNCVFISADSAAYLWKFHEAEAKPNKLKGVRSQIYGATELDGENILTWSDDNTLRIWGSDGTLKARLFGHRERIRGALQLHDRRVISWSDDGMLCLWQVKLDGNGIDDKALSAATTFDANDPNTKIPLRDGGEIGIDRKQRRVIKFTESGTEPVNVALNEAHGISRLNNRELLFWGRRISIDQQDDFESYSAALELWDENLEKRIENFIDPILPFPHPYGEDILGVIPIGEDAFIVCFSKVIVKVIVHQNSRKQQGVFKGILAISERRFITWSESHIQLWNAELEMLATFRPDFSVANVSFSQATVRVECENGHHFELKIVD